MTGLFEDSDLLIRFLRNIDYLPFLVDFVEKQHKCSFVAFFG